MRDRLAAIQVIWGFSSEGRAWQDAYDFRQMPVQPAWFGSLGYRSWAGAGQAAPGSIAHELGHSYWGAFPVAGRPELDPDYGSDSETPAVLEAYRADLLAFMRQPPDRFEPLRDRFRNLPGLDTGQDPDLHHFGEAEMVQFTGGHLNLVPPILRRYFLSYLTDDGVGGRFEDWAGALSWWLALTDDERRTAGEVFGLQHFPLDPYGGLKPGGGGLAPGLVTVLEGEERQRLLDFAAHFDDIKQEQAALVDAAGTDRGFGFWRDYLRNMLDLHRRHPDVLATWAADRGRELGAALDFYVRIGDLDPADQAREYRLHAGDDAIRDFAPLLKGRALLDLFPDDGAASNEAIQGAIAWYAAQLRRLVAIADAALTAGRDSPAAGARQLADGLASLSDDEIASSVDTVFDTMREADAKTTAAMISLLPDETLLRLLEHRPSAARAPEVPAERLLTAAGVTADAPADRVIAGMALLAENSSGNFAIDARFDEAVYDLLDRRAAAEPGLPVLVFRDTRLRILPWLTGHSESAAAALRHDTAVWAELIGAFDGPEPTPARAVRALAYGQPETAAALLAEFDRRGRRDVVTATLNTLAYDAYWAGLGAGPEQRLESVAALLAALRSELGEGWIATALLEAVAAYEATIAAGDVEPGFAGRFQDTLAAASAAAPDAAAARLLTGLAARLAH